MNKIVISAILLALSLSANADMCTVTRVIDGDTFVAKCATNPALHVRMTKIDSYESKRNNRAYKQAYNEQKSVEEIVALGKQASAVSKELLTNKIVRIEPNAQSPLDRYGRTLAEIYLDDVNVNDKLLAEYPLLFKPY